MVYIPTDQSLSGGLQIEEGFNNAISVPVLNYLLNIVSISVLALFALFMIYEKEMFKEMNYSAKLLLIGLPLMALVLAVAAFSKISLDPWRQAVDLATIIGMIIAVGIGSLLVSLKGNAIKIIVGICICLGLFLNVPTWLDNNNAIRNPDKQTIEYMKINNIQTYSCSANVAYWVYDRFSTSEWVKDGGEIFVERNIPMTPGSTIDNTWYRGHGSQLSDKYSLVKDFKENEIDIKIYALGE
jgi:hypothetical protein